MRKYVKFQLMLVLLLVLLLAQPVLAVGPGYYSDPHYVISGRNDMCNTCHQMNADGTAKPATFIQTTIYGTCFTCHNGTKSNYKVDGTVDNATGTPGFLASSSIHRVKTETLYQAVLDSTYSAMKLTCVSCHAAHGNVNYRYLKTTLSTGAANLNVYNQLTRPADYATGKDQVVYGEGIDNWCGGCHNKTTQHTGADGSIRHLTNWPLSPAIAAIYNAYVYNPSATDWHAAPKVPLGVGVVRDAGGNVTGMGNEQRVICMSCHQAHGSNLDKNLMRDKRGRICMQCHMDNSQDIK